VASQIANVAIVLNPSVVIVYQPCVWEEEVVKEFGFLRSRLIGQMGHVKMPGDGGLAMTYNIPYNTICIYCAIHWLNPNLLVAVAWACRQ